MGENNSQKTTGRKQQARCLFYGTQTTLNPMVRSIILSPLKLREKEQQSFCELLKQPPLTTF
jgi:hypothetical protein